MRPTGENRRGEKFFWNLLDNIPLGVVAWTAEGRFLKRSFDSRGVSQSKGARGLITAAVVLRWVSSTFFRGRTEVRTSVINRHKIS